MQPIHKLLSTKTVAIVALSSAFYVVAAGLSGLVLPAVRGYPAHFFRGLAMSAAAAYTGQMWSVTFMAIISGLLLVAVVPAPAPYLLPATVAAGVVYDLAMAQNYITSSRSPRKITLATLTSGLVEGITAMGILTYIGLFNTTPTTLVIIWTSAIAANMILSVIGAQITVLLIRRFQK